METNHEFEDESNEDSDYLDYIDYPEEENDFLSENERSVSDIEGSDHIVFFRERFVFARDEGYRQYMNNLSAQESGFKTNSRSTLCAYALKDQIGCAYQNVKKNILRRQASECCICLDPITLFRPEIRYNPKKKHRLKTILQTQQTVCCGKCSNTFHELCISKIATPPPSSLSDCTTPCGHCSECENNLIRICPLCRHQSIFLNHFEPEIKKKNNSYN